MSTIDRGTRVGMRPAYSHGFRAVVDLAANDFCGCALVLDNNYEHEITHFLGPESKAVTLAMGEAERLYRMCSWGLFVEWHRMQVFAIQGGHIRRVAFFRGPYRYRPEDFSAEHIDHQRTYRYDVAGNGPTCDWQVTMRPARLVNREGFPHAAPLIVLHMQASMEVTGVLSAPESSELHDVPIHGSATTGVILNLSGENPDLRYLDRKSTRLNSSHTDLARMPSSA